MPELYPEFERLGRHVLTEGEPAAAVGEGSGPFDFGLFGGDPDAGGGFDSFDAFDSFDGIDAGVDAGGGWGGDGGGGGGEGGGGG